MPPKAVRRGPRASTRSDAAAEGEPRNDEANAAQSESPAAGSAASSSARPPVQRLQSLNRRTPGGSITPRASIARDELNPPKPTLKFQPRAPTRRNKEEREAMEKLEAERNRERIREAMEIQKARRGTGIGSRGAFRGRGGGIGAGGSGAGGPMGAGTIRRGRGGRMEDSRASSASRHSIARSVTAAASGSAADGSSDESDSGIRVSIDHINLDDDDDDDDLDMLAIEKVKGKKAVKHSRNFKNRGLRPVRVERHEHEERTVGVNTEASSATSAELRRQAHDGEDADDSLFVDGRSRGEAEPRIKAEPTDEDATIGDVPHSTDQETIEDTESPLPTQTVRARKRISVQEPRSLLQTKEEIEEFDRHVKDLELMKELLSIDERPVAEKPTMSTADREIIADAGGDANSTETTDEETTPIPDDKHSGQLFLIQFPPLTPNLILPEAISQTVEDQHGDAGEDVQITHAGARPERPSVKPEHGELDDVKTSVHLSRPSKLVTATQQQLPAGRVGRLHLHASGRVTMDWGGISFELNQGTEVDFLQEALIATTPSSTMPGVDETDEKKVWAMGQLSGKFVAQPDWSQLL
jgi:DNA-directed RNA polymerase III subunit RPC4